MPDSPLGGKHFDRLVRDIKVEFRESRDRTRQSVTADGYPPGTVPVTDAARQLQRLTELAQTGSRLSPAEQARLSKLSDASGSLLG